MILLADSGSTKTDWCVVDNGQAALTIKTKGTNPFFQTEEEIAEEIKSSLLPSLPTTQIEDVYFYGAGCTPEKLPILEAALRRHLHITGRCEVATDMLAAARSLCGHKPGIACIMGTGSNSCAYDGEKIVKNVSPLGFILDRKSTRLNSSHANISYAVFCLKKKKSLHFETNLSNKIYHTSPIMSETL